MWLVIFQGSYQLFVHHFYILEEHLTVILQISIGWYSSDLPQGGLEIPSKFAFCTDSAQSVIQSSWRSLCSEYHWFSANILKQNVANRQSSSSTESSKKLVLAETVHSDAKHWTKCGRIDWRVYSCIAASKSTPSSNGLPFCLVSRVSSVMSSDSALSLLLSLQTLSRTLLSIFPDILSSVLSLLIH